MFYLIFGIAFLGIMLMPGVEEDEAKEILKERKRNRQYNGINNQYK